MDMEIQDIIGYVRDIPTNEGFDMEYQNEILRLLEEWEEGHVFNGMDDDAEDETEEEE